MRSDAPMLGDPEKSLDGSGSFESSWIYGSVIHPQSVRVGIIEYMHTRNRNNDVILPTFFVFAFCIKFERFFSGCLLRTVPLGQMEWLDDLRHHFRIALFKTRSLAEVYQFAFRMYLRDKFVSICIHISYVRIICTYSCINFCSWCWHGFILRCGDCAPYLLITGTEIRYWCPARWI